MKVYGEGAGLYGVEAGGRSTRGRTLEIAPKKKKKKNKREQCFGARIERTFEQKNKT